jgi:glutathione synthase/RimK-type ligase-like ATP-grasp enzyme
MFSRLLLDACRDLDIAADGFDDGWMFRLRRGRARRLVFGYDLGLNSSTAHLTARYKASLAATLRRGGVRCVPHVAFRNPSRTPVGVPLRPRWAAMLRMLRRWNHDVVCKPNEGGGGRLVTRVRNDVELEQAAEEILRHGFSVAISPFRRIRDEFRVVVLAGACVLVYRKVPTAGDWRHNLSVGAHAQILSKPTALNSRLRELALRAATEIDASFVSVDVIRGGSALEVMEINGAVLLEHLARQDREGLAAARAVYRAALEHLFAR